MSTDLKIVPMPLLPVSDIPAQLRKLAGRIESGDIETTAVMCIVPQDTSLPQLFFWGSENNGPHDDIGILELAKAAIIRRFDTE